MKTKLTIGLVGIVMVALAAYAFSQKNSDLSQSEAELIASTTQTQAAKTLNTTEETSTTGEFSCSSDEYYLKMNEEYIAVDFGRKQNPLPSRIYIGEEGMFYVYHDDQYDPIEQKDNLPALKECTRDGKTVFEIYGRSAERFQDMVDTAKRNDLPSKI